MYILDTKKGLLISGIVLGLVAVMLAFFGNPKNMAICTACFIRDSAGAMKLHSAAVAQYMRPEIVGIICGACLLAILTREYRSVSGSSPMIRLLLGVIMMIGALVFLGCPLRMLLRMSAGDLNAYVGLVGFIAGVLTGAVALKMGYSLGKVQETQKEAGYVLPVILGILLILSLTTTLLASSESGPGSMHAPVLLSLVGGLVFGAIAQRSRACFAGTVRNIFLAKNFDMALVVGGIFVIMLLYNIVTGNFKLSFSNQPIAHAQHIWNFLGLYVVGFAAVLAGGCPLRQLILAGQGSSDAGITFIGLLLGAALAHNFSLVSGVESAATDSAAAVAGGPGIYGKVAILLCIIVLFALGFFVKEKK